MALGGADVGGGDDAQGAAAVEVGAQRAFEDPEAVPLDEGAEQVDAIGGGDLGLEDLAEAGLAAGVDEEIAGSGDGGRWQLLGAKSRRFGQRGQEGGGLS